MAGNSLRVHWRSAGGNHSYITEMVGSSNNYTCTASPGQNSCDLSNIQCGDIYHVVVAPLSPEGSKVLFCPQRLYSGMTMSGDEKYLHLFSSFEATLVYSSAVTL